MNDLKHVLAIAGRPGLFQLVASTRTGLVAEPLGGGARVSASARQQVHVLDEMALYTVEGERPLREVFAVVGAALNGQEAVAHNADSAVVTAAFAKLVPDYDDSRVYVSDMRKFFQWYNALVRYQFFADAPAVANDEPKAKPAKKKAAPKAADGE
ncbi:MAG: DUF5606 domain-containing protein [Bacteroidota bacterium]